MRCAQSWLRYVGPPRKEPCPAQSVYPSMSPNQPSPSYADPAGPIMTEQQRQVPELKWVDNMSRLLDSKFRIPGTEQRFGVDFVLGLVPFAGDLVSLGMSGVLVATMAKNGASPSVSG